MANPGRPKTVNADDTETQENAAKAAQAELPPAGHARREAMKRRQDTLEWQIAQLADKMLSGTIDTKELEIVNEIANKTQFLAVSNPDPAFVYGWMSTNRYGQHIQTAKALGWITVNGDSKEAIELKGTTDGATTRTLGDVILMKMPKDRYIVLRAKEQADARRKQQNSASSLVELGLKNRDKGFKVSPYKMDSFDGPEIKSRPLSTKTAAYSMLDKALRDGTVPGMEIDQ